MAIRLQLRRDTSSNWSTNNPILQLGEFGFDVTANRFKVGIASNETSRWNVLPYLNVIPSELKELAQDFVEESITAGTGISKSYNDAANTLTISIDSTIANKEYVDAAVSSLDTSSSEAYIPFSLLGQVDGVAELDQNGLVPDSQIPDSIARDSEVASAISTAISNLIDSAPSALDTLNEIAAAINDDSSYAATITTALSGKVDSNYVTIGNTLLDGISGQTYGLIGTSAYLDVKNTNGYNKEIELDITALETKLDTDGYVKQAALDNKVSVSDPSLDYYVTNSGSGGYLVNGVLNGTINFVKGKKHRIFVNATGHPFWIQTVSGGYSASDIYSSGITNGGTDNGSIIVELPQSAPDNLYYACQYHSSMAGSINSYLVEPIVIEQKSSSYTISSADGYKMIEMSNGGTVTISDSSNFPIGFSVDVLQTTSSQVTIAGNGFTPNATPGLKLRTQWSSATLIKRALNSWVVLGDLSA